MMTSTLRGIRCCRARVACSLSGGERAHLFDDILKLNFIQASISSVAAQYASIVLYASEKAREHAGVAHLH